MASVAGQYALGGGMGALGGAGAGAATGLLWGSAGGPIGAGIGAGVGLGLGLLGTGLDIKAQKEMEEALEAAEREYEEAQRRFNRQTLQAGAAAREAVSQGMAAKGAADASRIDQSMDEAAALADRSGLIGAEKADFISQHKQGIEREVAASSPAVYQQALGGARAEQQLAIQKAAIGLQSAGQEFQMKTGQIMGQPPPGAGKAVGESLGAIMQGAGALHGAGVGQPGAPAEALGAAPGTERMAAPTPLTETEITALEPGLTEAQSMQGVPDIPTPEVGYKGTFGATGTTVDPSMSARSKLLGGVDVAGGAQPLPETVTPAGAGEQPTFTGAGIGQEETLSLEESGLTDEQLLELQSQELVPREQNYWGFASGGIAGQGGPEVAVLGEEGPELVLNAQQTAQLAQAMGGAQAYQEGGVAGLEGGMATGDAGGGADDSLEADYLAGARGSDLYKEALEAQGDAPGLDKGTRDTKATEATPEEIEEQLQALPIARAETQRGTEDLMSADELMAYMTELNARLSGALG